MGFENYVSSESTTNKIRKITPIKNYLVNKINENQELKRLCCYLTKMPLENRSVDYSNKIIYQRDLTIDMTKGGTVYTGKDPNDKTKFIEVNQVLFPYTYNAESVNKEQVYIFVHNFSNDFDDFVGDNIFAIDLLVPWQYDPLEPYGEQRIYEIASRIGNLFDNVPIEEKYTKKIGDIDLEICGKSKEQRLSRTDNITIYTIYIKARLNNGRG